MSYVSRLGYSARIAVAICSRLNLDAFQSGFQRHNRRGERANRGHRHHSILR